MARPSNPELTRVEESAAGAHSSRRPVAPTIVIVGHGMVGQRLAEEIRRRPQLADHRVVIFGEEPHPAYDRVHLRDVLRGHAPSELHLSGSDWYEQHSVEVVGAERVTQIDRDNRCVITDSGRVERYGHLILATGSNPVIGKIDGNRGRDVVTLRTIEDALTIRERALELASSERQVAIVGGGLLGIELADELTRLEVRCTVVESADFPLSRQVDEVAGHLLSGQLAGPLLELRSGCRLERIVEDPEGSRLVLEGGESIECALVVIAIGVRPRDELAKEAGLRCDLFGGVEVNDQLLTSDPNISAVGECVRHRGLTYGLVAPGYAMAELVAGRLAGERGRFDKVQVGTRLKAAGVELSVVGNSNVSGLGIQNVVYAEGEIYRRLSLRRGRVIGVVSVGPWEDLARVQEAMARAERIKPAQLDRFRADEPMWKDSKLSLRTWPDSATVCTCMGVTCGALRRANEEGCATVEALAERTGASTVCGTCRPLLATLTEAQPEEAPGPSRWMTGLSVASIVGAAAFAMAPAVPYADSVQVEGIDVLWRTSLYKQVTGFSLAGLFALSILFSMRKRISWMSFGDFEAWRISHALLGVLCLVGGFLHTGFRLGVQLDAALISVLLGSVLLGGVAGGWDALAEALPAPAARRARGWLIRSHIYLLWPLPVLLAAHVAKVYFF